MSLLKINCYIFVLKSSHRAYVGSVLNLDFWTVSYAIRLFPILYENSVCST